MKARARATARSVALWGLSGAALAPLPLGRSISRRRVHFLCLHHVFPNEEARFRRLLDVLSPTHDVIPYSEGVERLLDGRLDRPYACLSFDDGLACCSRAGEILAEYNISACFFLVASMVGERNPDRVASFCRNRLHRPETDLLDWDDVAGLQARGHEIGSHSVSHARLASVSSDQLWHELHGSRELLESRVGRVRHFAWPYGLFADFSANAAEITFGAGYQSCASGLRGAHVQAPTPSEPPPCIRREPIIATWPLAHIRYFLARSAARAGPEDNSWPWTLSRLEPR